MFCSVSAHGIMKNYCFDYYLYILRLQFIIILFDNLQVLVNNFKERVNNSFKIRIAELITKVQNDKCGCRKPSNKKF